MKKIGLLLIGLLLILSSCHKNIANDYIVFSGKIENADIDSLQVMNQNLDIVHSFYITENKTFKDTLKIPEGYYYIKEGNNIVSIYLKPNFNLNLDYNQKVFTGIGANENNYLVEKSELEKSFGKLSHYSHYAKLNETDFLHLTDSLHHKKTTLFDKKKSGFEPSFTYIEENSIAYRKLMTLSRFEEMKHFVTDDKQFKVSSNYPKLYENINLSDEKLINSLSYIFFIDAYFGKKTNEELKKDPSQDYLVRYLNLVNSEVTNPKIKEKISHKIGKFQLNQTTKLDKLYQLIIANITNNKLMNDVEENYKKLKKVAVGSQSPTFELPDINKKLVNLNDLKGKIVYIDIWATWCLPCVKEIPSLKKLEVAFKNKDIQFVSICKSDHLKSWEKMIKEDNLGGIQLFAPDENIAFFKDYMVFSIPRFILLDKTGKIIDANAKSPSNPELKSQLESLL
jgi:thiol-disulfide isomerase/thioredoxin